MSQRQPGNKWTSISVPPQFRLGLEGIAKSCDWVVRQRDGVLQVAAAERYWDRVPQFLTLNLIADNTNADDPHAYASLGRWPRQDQYLGPTVTDRIKEVREVKDPKSAKDSWTSFRLQFATLPDRELPAFLHGLFPQITASLPTATLWAIDIAPAVTWRIAAARMLFSAQQSPELLNRAADARGFPAPMGLMPSFAYGLNCLVEPLLLPAAPWIVGMNSYRQGGHVVVMFGTAEAGFGTDQVPEIIDLLRARTMTSSRVPVGRPVFSRDGAERWLRWWVTHVNALVGQAMDVGRYVDASGMYNPAAHLGVLLSLDRLFATVQEVLADGGRSGFSRVLMMFDVIDLLDGLSFGSWESMLHADKVARNLVDLEAILPAPARDLVLTRCRPAVAALGEFRDGFKFVRDRLTEDGQMINIRRRDGKGASRALGKRCTGLSTHRPKRHTFLSRNGQRPARRLVAWVASRRSSRATRGPGLLAHASVRCQSLPTPLRGFPQAESADEAYDCVTR